MALSMLFLQIGSRVYPRLRVLSLAGNAIPHSAMSTFADTIRWNAVARLTSLNLSGCSLSVHSLSILARAIQDRPLQQLKRLSLARNRIRSKEMVMVATMLQSHCLPSLEELDISDNPIGDEGIQECNAFDLDGVLEQVITLNMTNCKIGQDGGYAIYDNIHLGFWKSVQKLVLAGTELSENKK